MIPTTCRNTGFSSNQKIPMTSTKGLTKLTKKENVVEVRYCSAK